MQTGKIQLLIRQQLLRLRKRLRGIGNLPHLRFGRAVSDQEASVRRPHRHGQIMRLVVIIQRNDLLKDRGRRQQYPV
ncbi:hypothetical protein D3C75_726730 [compost metagenome]